MTFYEGFFNDLEVAQGYRKNVMLNYSRAQDEVISMRYVWHGFEDDSITDDICNIFFFTNTVTEHEVTETIKNRIMEYKMINGKEED